MIRSALSLALIAALATGCASRPKHNCPLDDLDGRCASVQQTYEAAVSDGGDKEYALPKKDAPEQPVTTPVTGEFFTPYTAAIERGAPVYQPPVPHRLWKAPTYDAGGLLHGGELIYYTTPGRWNYGTLTTPGQGAGVMGPLQPSDLGFTSLPADGKALDSAVDVETRNGVIQPYEHLTPGLRSK